MPRWCYNGAMNITVLEPLGLPRSAVEEILRPLTDAGHTVTIHEDRPSDTDETIRRLEGAEIAVDLGVLTH